MTCISQKHLNHSWKMNYRSTLTRKPLRESFRETNESCQWPHSIINHFYLFFPPSSSFSHTHREGTAEILIVWQRWEGNLARNLSFRFTISFIKSSSQQHNLQTWPSLLPFSSSTKKILNALRASTSGWRSTWKNLCAWQLSKNDDKHRK